MRDLRADEIDLRIQQIKAKDGVPSGLILLCYKDARVDMDILDEEYTPMGWQRTHEFKDGKLYCTVSVWDKEKKCWISKEDVGTESNTEAEKGQASDSFKRANFNWGIGRELYTSPFIWIPADLCRIKDTGKKDKFGTPIFACNDKFTVESITIDSKVITAMTVKNNDTGKIVFAWSKSGEGASKTPVPQKEAKFEESFKCSRCGKEMKAVMCKDGRTMTAKEITDYSVKKFGVPMCPECQKERINQNEESRRGCQ